MYRSLNIAVVIPALNEEAAIASVLRDVPAWVDAVIVADNGSTDRTADVARSLGARVVSERRRGYGSACLAALGAIGSADVIVFLDADRSDQPREMERLLRPIAEGRADLVIGSRVLGRCEPGALTPQQRFGNALACLLIRWIYGVRFTDLGPFRAVRRSALDRLRMDDRGYGWTCQMQVRAARTGMPAVEVPVGYRRRIGRSKISGTFRGVLGAGGKILYTIFREAFRTSRQPRPDRSTRSEVRAAGTAGGDRQPWLSVVIPTLNEENNVGGAIRSAQTSGEGPVEVIVVDGGSDDRTIDVAGRCGAVVLRAGRGRARQMNAGAAVARGEVLLFLHADSLLPPGYGRRVRRLLSTPGTAAGAFSLAIEPKNWQMRLYAAAANFRSRALQTPYGDQATFLTCRRFQQAGGFPRLPVMEDLEMTRRLRRLGRIRIANATVATSARRWQRHGAWRMSLLNQIVTLAYFVGVSPERLYYWRESGIIVPRRSLLTELTPGRAARRVAAAARTDPDGAVMNPEAPT